MRRARLLAVLAVLLGQLALVAVAAAAPRLTPDAVRERIEADARVVDARATAAPGPFSVTHDERRAVWVGRLRAPGATTDQVVVTVRDADGEVTDVAVAPVAARLSEADATAIAERSSKARDWVDRYRDAGRPVTTRTEFANGVWTRRWWSGGEQIAEVVVDDGEARVRNAWTGPQVAWHMARGGDGAFGRKINEPWILFPILAAFILGMADWRRPLSWRNADVLMLASFVVSLLLFNEGLIFWSVPLAYPPLLYLFARLLAIGFGRGRRRSVVTRWPVWLIAGLAVFAFGFRAGLNFWSSNVIDVGYASVVGADRMLGGESPYGTMPRQSQEHCGKRYADGSWQAYIQTQRDRRCESPVERGDTYGPVMYLAYVPFTLALGWSGLWDDLPAAHGTAVLFDALAAAGLCLAGFRIGGIRLAAAVLFLWAAFPFTTYAMSSNSNDAVVAALLAWGLALFSWPTARGLLLGLAALAKFAPLLLVPLWLRADRRPAEAASRGTRGGRLRGAVLGLWPGASGLRVAAGLALAGVLAFGALVVLDGPSALRVFWERTFGWQLDRPSPFSVWDWGGYPGFPDLAVPQKVLKALLVGLAAALFLVPRRLDVVRVAALSAALLVGFQLVLTHWFYLYIPWFVPFAAIALLAPRPALDPEPSPEPVPAAPAAALPARDVAPV